MHLHETHLRWTTLLLLIAVCIIYFLVIFVGFGLVWFSSQTRKWIRHFAFLNSVLLWLIPCLLLSGQCSVLKTDPGKNQGPSATNGGRAEDGRSTWLLCLYWLDWWESWNLNEMYLLNDGIGFLHRRFWHSHRSGRNTLLQAFLWVGFSFNFGALVSTVCNLQWLQQTKIQNDNWF